MKAAVLVLVVVAAAVAVPMQWLELEKARTITKGPRLGEVYSFCNKTVGNFIINHISLVPDPPVKGQPLKVVVTYDLKEEVTGGQAKVSAKVDGIPIFEDTYQLCDLLSQFGVICPVKPFSGTNSTSQTLPDIGGHITAHADVTDQNDKELACVDLDIHV